MLTTTGVGRSDSVLIKFVSTAASYAGGTSGSGSPYSAVWTIEGVKYPVLNPGTVVFAGDKSVWFEITPADRLTGFTCRGNSLTGPFPAGLLNCHNLLTLDVANNALSGPVPSLSDLKYLNDLELFTNGFTGTFPSLAGNALLTILSIAGNSFSGAFPDISPCTGMTQVYAGACGFSGSLPSLSANTALLVLTCNSNSLSGNIPTLASNTVLGDFEPASNQFTGVAPGFAVPPSLHVAYFQNNLLTQAAVDAILAAFVTAGAVGAYQLNAGGTGNATPSAAGLANKATLVTRGWTVTTN
jgi:hypothetical protein